MGSCPTCRIDKVNYPNLLKWLSTIVIAAVCGCGRQPPPADGAPAPPDTSIVRALGGEPETLDPRLAADNPSIELAIDLFEGLTVEAPDGAIVPGAAKSWTVSDDGRTWTFTLRPGLTWSDGTPLTAADFARGLDEATADGSQAPNAPLLEAVASVEVRSKDTLLVRLSRPVPYLPALLALPVAAPERNATRTESDTLVSNGPYRLAERRTGESVTLERNPRFHEARGVSVAHVTYLTTDDLNTELNLYREGSLDLTSEVPNAHIEWIHSNLPTELHVAPYLSSYGYAVNTSRLRSREARVALAMALDRRPIVEKVTGAGERAALAWVPPWLGGYTGASFDWASLDDASRIEHSRELWGKSGQAGRTKKIVLCTDASANHHRTAVALADQWKSVLGLEVEIREMEWKAYLVTREHPADCDLVRFGWSADFADPESFLALFESHHPQNVAGFSNPEFDRLLSASRLETDASRRARLLAQAEAVLLRDVPVIPVFHRVTKRLVKPYVAGYHDNPLGHVPTRYLSRTKKEGGSP